jgi:hypothetical protein
MKGLTTYIAPDDNPIHLTMRPNLGTNPRCPWNVLSSKWEARN